MEKLLSLPQAAKILGVNKDKMKLLIYKYNLPHQQVGHFFVLPEKEVLEFKETHNKIQA